MPGAVLFSTDMKSVNRFVPPKPQLFYYTSLAGTPRARFARNFFLFFFSLRWMEKYSRNQCELGQKLHENKRGNLRGCKIFFQKS